MRRPAQHRPGLAAAHGWTHPYAGIESLAVFYNDGGNPPADPPKPGPPPAPAPTPQYTQEDLERIAAKEKDQGKRAGARQALEDLAKELGFTKPDDVKTFVATARKAQQDALTEQERLQQQLAEDRKRIDQETARIAEERRMLAREQALTRLGALDVTDDQGQVSAPNLQDALAILDRELRDAPDADAAQIAAAAARVKQRHPALFGSAPAPMPNPLPPAPGGAPASAPPARSAPGKDDAKARARALAVKMGYAKPDAA
ncbi:hypothetical protein ACFVOR_37120 [Streptomyces sp. NPDC057837]|uniref:hypothetical protein n=1 Tax=Streptomyces sp. NPDC057837 TaxID=3346260 RepID=UPI003699FFBC